MRKEEEENRNDTYITFFPTTSTSHSVFFIPFNSINRKQFLTINSVHAQS